MLCLVLLHHFSFQRKYCNKDCNWEGVPNGTLFKLWGDPYENNKIKNKFRLRERRETYSILVTISILIDILETCCCREYVCLTEVDNHTTYGHWRIIDGVHAQEMAIYIRWWYWSNIPQVVIIPEARYYRYCSWRQMLLLSCWCQILLLSCWSHILFLSSWS